MDLLVGEVSLTGSSRKREKGIKHYCDAECQPVLLRRLHCPMKHFVAAALRHTQRGSYIE